MENKEHTGGCLMNDDMYHFLLAEGNKTFQRLSMTDEPELIPEREAFRAYFVIENLRLVDNPEAYLFCTALNLLSRFVKQSHGISYAFKRRIDRLISHLSRHPSEDVIVDIQSNRKMSLLVLKFDDVMFSFHNLQNEMVSVVSSSDKIHRAALERDGIRKQKCSMSVFRHGWQVLACSCDPKKEVFENLLEQALEKYDNGEALLTKGGISTPERKRLWREEQAQKKAERKKQREQTRIGKAKGHPQKMSWRRQSIHNILEHLSAEDQKKFLNLKLSLD